MNNIAFRIGLALVLFSLIAKQGMSQEYKVKIVKNIPYYEDKDADSEKHKLDIYVPKGAKNFPVLFFIHGGGWQKGSRQKFAKLGKTFAARGGVITVCPSYRLTPKVKHPGHIEDVAKAFAWTHENIEKYGGSKENIFVSGHSAGGHLAGLLGTDASYLRKNKLDLNAIQGVIPVSGVFHISPGRMVSVFTKDPEKCKQASPITHVNKNCPPFFIIYAEKDINGSFIDFHNALKKAKVPSEYKEFEGRNHGSVIHNVQKDGDVVFNAMMGFIRRHNGIERAKSE